MEQWVKTFRILANKNRLRILKLLTKHRELSVKQISKALGITEKLASQHVVLLAHADVIEGKVKLGRVYYALSFSLSPDIRHILSHFVKDR